MQRALWSRTDAVVPSTSRKDDAPSPSRALSPGSINMLAHDGHATKVSGGVHLHWLQLSHHLISAVEDRDKAALCDGEGGVAHADSSADNNAVCAITPRGHEGEENLYRDGAAAWRNGKACMLVCSGEDQTWHLSSDGRERGGSIMEGSIMDCAQRPRE